MDPEALLEQLHARGATLATAESLTGGRLAALLTGVPGASRVYRGGVVAYATEVKVSLLGVTDALVAAEGVVSEACARAMAEGVRDRLATTYGLSTTGVAGPDSQEGHPVGTVFVGVAGPDGTTAAALGLRGHRTQIQEQTCREALVVLGEQPGLG